MDGDRIVNQVHDVRGYFIYMHAISIESFGYSRLKIKKRKEKKRRSNARGERRRNRSGLSWVVKPRCLGACACQAKVCSCGNAGFMKQELVGDSGAS